MYFDHRRRYQKMTVKDLRYFTFENYCKRIGFTKEDSCYLLKKQKTIFALVIFASYLNKQKQTLLQLKDIINYF